MQAMSLNVVAIFLSIMLSSSVPVYAVEANDAKLLKRFNKIEKNKKKIENQKTVIKIKKQRWAKSAEK